jgi:polyisoprenoid-binding protein YceI
MMGLVAGKQVAAQQASPQEMLQQLFPQANQAMPNIVPTHQVIKERSKISYSAKVNGDLMEGDFKDYNALICFNPNRPQDSYLRLNFKLSPQTISTSNAAIPQGILGADLANLGLSIPATFEAKELELISDSDYRGRGVLSLMGQKQVIEFQLLVINGDSPLFGNEHGVVSFTTYLNINRLKFGRFKGEKAAGYNVGNDIGITANLVTKVVAQQ